MAENTIQDTQKTQTSTEPVVESQKNDTQPVVFDDKKPNTTQQTTERKPQILDNVIDKTLGGMRNWFAKRSEQKKAVVEEKKVASDDKKPETEKSSGFFSFFSGNTQKVEKKHDTFDLYEAMQLSPEQIARLNADDKKKIVEAEKLFQEGVASIRDLISPSYFEVSLTHMRIGEQYVKSFYVYSYPRYIETNWLAPVINYEATVDIAQFIYPIESAHIMKVLSRKVTQMSASVHMNQAKGIISDPGLETALEDAEDLRVRLQRGEEKFFQFALYFTIYADDEKKLEQVSKRIETLLGGKLVLSKRADFQMEHAFNSTLPLCLDEVEVFRNMNTSPLSSTFPFSSSTLTTNDGVLYGLNRHNDSLIIFDRFSLENANGVIFAKSGAGKSYAVKLEILRSLMMGTDVIIIDPENEYESLSETVGGSYLKVSLNSDRRINPFDLPRGLKDEALKPGDLLRSNIISLHGLLKLMLGDMTATEEALIDKALIDTYAIKGMTMDKVTYVEEIPPTMEDLYDVLDGMEGAENLATKLEKFTKGTFSGIFNKETNVDLYNGLMVFSIRDLEDSLRPIAMYIILNYIWNNVRSSLKRRILIVDEAWSLMQHEDSAKFLFGLVKRARKYWLGITTITQDVEDFMKSNYGKPIVTNSSMQLLLKQSPSAIEPLSQAFNLTEGEKYMLLNSGVGQGLFFAGNQHAAIQVIASYTEDKIVTTNPEEIAQSAAEAVDFSTENELPTAEAETAAENAVLGGSDLVQELALESNQPETASVETESQPITDAQPTEEIEQPIEENSLPSPEEVKKVEAEMAHEDAATETTPSQVEEKIDVESADATHASEEQPVVEKVDASLPTEENTKVEPSAEGSITEGEEK